MTIKVTEGSSSVDLNVPVLDDTFDFYKPIIDSLGTVEPSAQ